MTSLATERLLLNRLSYDNAEFIIELVNEPSFVRYIGDKDVHTVDDARRYMQEGPVGAYERYGYGMFLVTPRNDPAPTGICGLMKRDEFDEPDLGFAFLKRFTRRGYASESARAVLNHGFDELGLDRIIAIADPDNEPSLRVLEKLGFRYERKVRMQDDEFDINLYAIEK